MSNELNSYKKDLGYDWIKSESGSTWLCPVGTLAGIDNPSDEQLRALCVEESGNPQND